MNLKPLVITLIVLTSGCAVVHPPVRVYEGELPQGQAPALLKLHGYMAISSIDGKKVHYSAQDGLTLKDFELHFAPGPYRLGVGYYDGIFSSLQPAYTKVVLRAGKRYVLTSKTFGGSWAPDLIDVTDLPAKCFAVNLGALLTGPRGCDE